MRLMCLPPAVLFFTDRLQPRHRRSVQRLGNSEVGHGRLGCCTVPVALVRLEEHHVAGMDLLNWAALSLHLPQPGDDDNRLAEWMKMPVRARARFECDVPGPHVRGRLRVSQAVNAYGASEPIGGTFRGRSATCASDLP